MYNQEIKERFLAESLGNKNENTLRAKFDAIGIYEEQVGKDFAEMSMEEALTAMSEARTNTYGSAFSLLSLMRNYVKWCDDNVVFIGVNQSLVHLEIDDIDISKSLSELLFKNEMELMKELRSIREFEDGYTEAIILLLGWIGIEQKDVLSITSSDVDLQEKRVFLKKYDKFVSFSDNIAYAFSRYEKTKVGSRSSGGDSRLVYRDDSYDRFVRKYCAKGQLGKDFTPTQVKHAVNKLNLAYVQNGNEPRFTGSNVVMSGALYRVMLLEKSGVDVFSIKNKNAVLDSFFVKAKLHEVLWLYKNYKRAFSL